MTHSWHVQSIEELQQIALELLTFFPTPRIFAFEGEMGAGKTTFITHLLHQLGIQDMEGSPTYSIINEYSNPSGIKIYHLDCYRIADRHEVLNLGLDELLDEKAYFFIEWAEKIDFILPSDVIWVYIRNSDVDSSREISFQA